MELLAQGQQDVPWPAIIKWSMVLLGLLLVLALAAEALRRWATRSGGDEEPGGFTIGDLRRLHREGQITDEEFEKAKARIIGTSTAATSGETDSVEEIRRRVRQRQQRPPEPPERDGPASEGPPPTDLPPAA